MPKIKYNYTSVIFKNLFAKKLSQYKLINSLTNEITTTLDSNDSVYQTSIEPPSTDQKLISLDLG